MTTQLATPDGPLHDALEFLAANVTGTQEMPVGHTAYFTVELESGRYAWISESTAALGMVKEFTVK